MKPFILLISVAITGLFAIGTADKNISGTWVMEQGDSSDQPPVFRINMGEGILEGKMDVPEQEVYDRKVHSIRVDGDSVFITVYKNGATIYARRVNDSSITGVMKGESRVDTVKFKKNMNVIKQVNLTGKLNHIEHRVTHRSPFFEFLCFLCAYVVQKIS